MQAIALGTNLPGIASVPDGRDGTTTARSAAGGEPREFDFEPRITDLGAGLEMLDFDAAAKLTGSRFAVMSGPLARMHRALTQFMLDVHTGEHGYTEAYVPYMVNPDSLHGTGQLPKFAEDLFRLEGTDYFLIPTAEVPLTNLVRDVIVDDSYMPRRYVAHTPCFRSEAGAYGKDTRGMIRQHQFDKVELVHIVRPADAFDALEAPDQPRGDDSAKLGLPYRAVTLCTGDGLRRPRPTTSRSGCRAGQYREISSLEHGRLPGAAYAGALAQSGDRQA